MSGMKEAIKAAIMKQAQRDEPLMDIDSVKSEFLEWLAELRLPADSGVDSWEECIRTNPSTPEEKEEDSGLRVRLSLQLQTPENRYLISIMECLDPESRGVYIMTAHVGWTDEERRIQKMVDEGYFGRFDDVLRPRHTLWAQTIRTGGLNEALNCCAKAILGNELVGKIDRDPLAHAIDRPQQVKTNFPL